MKTLYKSFYNEGLQNISSEKNNDLVNCHTINFTKSGAKRDFTVSSKRYTGF